MTSHNRNPLLPAVTALYLLVPTFFFAFGWLRLPVAGLTILALAGCAGVLLAPLIAWLRTLRESQGRPGILRASVPLAVAYGLAALLVLAWLLSSGAGGFGHQNEDYLASNALLKDLILQDWPITLTYEQAPRPIVYYLAYYLPAAAVGKLWGWAAANRFLFAWTALGVALALAWFVRVGRLRPPTRAIAIVAVAAIFCLAGGLDLIGYYVLQREAPFNMTQHVEHWARYMQYSSQTTLLYWVPQQCIAAWLVAGLVAESLLEPRDPSALVIALASSVIWTPFGLLGVAPYLLLLAALTPGPARRAALTRPRTLLVAPLAIWVGVVHLLFITANAGQFERGFIWQFIGDPETLNFTLAAFWWLEVGAVGLPMLALVTLGVLTAKPEPAPGASRASASWKAALGSQFSLTPAQLMLLLVSLATLSLLPLYKMGNFNDLVMRASIPSLFILWASATKVLLDASRQVRRQLGWLYGLLVAVIMLGTFSSFVEITRGVGSYSWQPPEVDSVISTTMLDQVEDEYYKLQRMGDPQAPFFRYLGK